jgi:pyruvate,water dikinase
MDMAAAQQQSAPVRWLGELAGAERASAGGKGGTLARLLQAGHPVPDGFVILPAAFAGDELEPSAWVQVRAHLAWMRKGGTDQSDGMTFAVRSSALSEDSAQASFAGEFETVLGVTSDKAVHDAIHAVRRSRHGERVQAYSQAKDLGSEHEMAVVVQRLVPAELSGVLFTADPVSGSRSQMAGNYVHGPGEQLVSGQAQARAFTFSRPRGTYEGPPELEPQARRLFKLGSRLEAELGTPQDIEWALARPGDGRGPQSRQRLYLLQSRPITTLQGYNPTTGAWNASLTGNYLWSNVNFGEAISEVMTPLSWSVIALTLEEWTLIPGVPPAGNIGGLPYLNLSTYASIYRALGKKEEALRRALEGTAYTRLPEGMAIPLIPLTWRDLLRIMPATVRMQVRQKQAVRRIPSYLETNRAWCRRMRQAIQEAGSGSGLIALWQREIEPHLRQSVPAILGSAMHAADHASKLYHDLEKLVGPDDADALTSNLSRGSELLASLGPLVGLARVARGEMEPEDYFEAYGHRGPDEFELSAPRPAEDADWLGRQLADFARAPVDVDRMLAERQEAFQAAWARFQTAHPRKAGATRRRIDEVGPRARLREAARSEYARDRWVVREFALRAGELASLGDGIFFLTVAEMLDLLAGDARATIDIPARRASHERHRELPAYPPIICGRFDPFQWAADPARRSDFFDAQAPEAKAPDASSRLISGSPGSAGRVEGAVRCLGGLDEGDALQPGEILVTAQTNIGWTFLFPRAAGIITDVGAPLSHAAIVARELGIPAVVGCTDATRRLVTGDRVRLDGGRGTVEILGEAAH